MTQCSRSQHLGSICGSDGVRTCGSVRLVFFFRGNVSVQQWVTTSHTPLPGGTPLPGCTPLPECIGSQCLTSQALFSLFLLCLLVLDSRWPNYDYVASH